MKHISLYAGVGLILIGTCSLFVVSTGAIAATRTVPQKEMSSAAIHDERQEVMTPNPKHSAREAVAACAQKRKGDVCIMHTPDGGTLRSTCDTLPQLSTVVCMPPKTK